MDASTIEEIKSLAISLHMNRNYLRYGQCLWNIAQDVVYSKGKYDVYKFEDLRGSDADPFHDDSKIDLFLEMLKEI